MADGDDGGGFDAKRSAGRRISIEVSVPAALREANFPVHEGLLRLPCARPHDTCGTGDGTADAVCQSRL